MESLSSNEFDNHHSAKGCVLIPTFEDTHLLIENFCQEPKLSKIEVYVLDDNFEEGESARIRSLCLEYGWQYRHTNRKPHAVFCNDEDDRSEWNRLMWQTMTQLGETHDYVVKLDTDTLILDCTWHEDFARALVDRTAYAGTPEHRPMKDVMAFFDLARTAGYDFYKTPYVLHVQGGISGYSSKALRKLRAMGFLSGKHTFFLEDCYLSYACQLLGIPFLRIRTVGSWWKPYRPKLETLSNLKAIHPLRHSEWRQHVLCNSSLLSGARGSCSEIPA